MRSLRTFCIGAVLASVPFMMASPALAIPLSELIDPQAQPIEVGDKLFDNFTATVTGIAPYTIDLSNIDVTAVNMGGGVYALTFTPVNPAAPIIAASPGGFVDLLLGFDVTVTDPLWQIDEIKLAFNANAPGTGFAQIVETVFGAGPQPTQIQVNTLGPSIASTQLPVPSSAITVYKDIAVIAGRDSSASITDFTQYFIQIPEPATASLLVLGGLALMRRRVVRRHAALVLALTLGMTGMLMQPAPASAVPLSDLTANPANTVPYGDFVFSNFDFNVVGSFGSFIADPAAIDVQGFTTPDGSEDGLRFVGLIAALSNVTPGSFVEMTLSYDVNVKDQGGLIKDVTMSFNGAPWGADSVTQVGKSVQFDGASVGELLVWNTPAATPAMRLQDHVDVTGGPYATLHVHDRIIVRGGEAGVTTISFINQTFSQVPEPMAAAMLLLGLPLLWRRRVL